MSDPIIDAAEQVTPELPDPIVTVDVEAPPQGQPIADLLINMFLRQLGHMAEYDKIYQAKGLRTTREYGNINDPHIQAKIRESFGYVIEEGMEAIGLLKNKPWKQTPRATDYDEFYKELADMWHFFLEFLVYCGMTPDIIQKYYFGIAESNDQRRTEGY